MVLGPTERVQQWTAKQLEDVPQIREEIVDDESSVPFGRVQQRTAEQNVDVTQLAEETVEEVRFAPRARVQQRTLPSPKRALRRWSNVSLAAPCRSSSPSSRHERFFRRGGEVAPTTTRALDPRANRGVANSTHYVAKRSWTSPFHQLMHLDLFTCRCDFQRYADMFCGKEVFLTKIHELRMRAVEFSKKIDALRVQKSRILDQVQLNHIMIKNL